MNAIVVYDSLRGNTQLIASAVGDAMAPLGDVRVYRVDQLPVGVHADAWVIGGADPCPRIEQTSLRFPDPPRAQQPEGRSRRDLRHALPLPAPDQRLGSLLG